MECYETCHSVVAADNVPPSIDSGYLTVAGTPGFKKVQIITHNPETAPNASGEHLSGNPAEIINSVQLRVRRFSLQLRCIQRAVLACTISETVSVIIAADNRAGAIDCKCGSAELGPWRVDCHEFSIVTQEAVEIQWPGQLVNTDDITVIVDSQHLSRSSAGNIYSRKPASPVNKPMNRVVGIEV